MQLWTQPIVLLPTVPRRIESFCRLLRNFHQQTLLPEHIVILFDGSEEEFGSWSDEVVDIGRLLRMDGVNLLHSLTHPDKAQSYRWTIVEAIRGDRVVLTMDDDMVLASDYVEKTISCLRTMEAAYTRPVLSWGGIDFDFKWRHYYEMHEACPLVRPQSGVMAFRAKHFHGITGSLFSRKSHVRGGSEELPLAWWADHSGRQLIRPPTPEKQVIWPRTKAAHDAGASYKNNQKRWVKLLEWAEESLGWRYAKPLRMMYEARRPLAQTRGGLSWQGQPDPREVFGGEG